MNELLYNTEMEFSSQAMPRLAGLWLNESVRTKHTGLLRNGLFLGMNLHSVLAICIIAIEPFFMQLGIGM